MPNRIIGYTTGVFDMFHIGHLNVLTRARERCDHLIVGVTTDELVWARKHKMPVICYQERFEIVKALRCVDEVVPQADMDKFGAYQRLGFHRMFVGGDWKGTPEWNEFERQLAPYGVEVVYLPHTDGVSSTLLSERLQGGEAPFREGEP